MSSRHWTYKGSSVVNPSVTKLQAQISALTQCMANCQGLQAPRPHRGGAVTAVSKEENKFSMAGPLPSVCVCINNGASMVDMGSILYIHTPSPVLSPGLSAGPEFQHSAPACNSRCMTQARECSTVVRSSVLVSLCFACHKPIVVYSFEALMLSFCPDWSPSGWRAFPGWGNLSYFIVPSQGVGQSPILYIFFLLFYAVTWWTFLQLLYEIFCSVQ